MSFFVLSSRKQFGSFQKCGYRRCYFAIRKMLGNTIFRRWWVSVPCRRQVVSCSAARFVLEIHHFCKILPILKEPQKNLRFAQMQHPLLPSLTALELENSVSKEIMLWFETDLTMSASGWCHAPEDSFPCD